MRNFAFFLLLIARPASASNQVSEPTGLTDAADRITSIFQGQSEIPVPLPADVPQAPQAQAAPARPERASLPPDQWPKPGGSAESLKMKFTVSAIWPFRKKRESTILGVITRKDRDGREWSVLTIKQYLGYGNEVFDATGCIYDNGHYYRIENYLGINGHWVYWDVRIYEPSLGGVSLKADGTELVVDNRFRVWAKDAAKIKDGSYLESLSWVKVKRAHNGTGYDQLIVRLEPRTGAALAEAEEAVKKAPISGDRTWFKNETARKLDFQWAAAQPLKAETVYL